MTSVRHRVGLLTVASLLGFIATGCGESKVSQCNKIVKVANGATTELQAATSNTKGDRLAQLTSVSGSMDKYAKEMQAVEVKDEKLQGFQTRFVDLYQQTGKGSLAIANAVKKKDLKGANTALKNLQASAQQEQKLVNEVNQYCRG